jgi:ATP-dependent helicase/nuclease subunit A
VTRERSDLRAGDERARRLARTLFDQPLVLEAGAGTGKTTVLVTRTLAWCLGPGWDGAEREQRGAHPDEIGAQVARGVVAITFTDAAAAEMGSRLAAALRDVEQGELPRWLPADALPADPALRALRARALLGALDQMRVQTIHAFCRRLLVAHPVEAGVHPRLELDADGALRAELVRDVLEETLPAAWEDPASPALRLAERGFGPGEIETALLALVEQGLGAEDLAEDPLAPERIGELVDRVTAALDGWLAAATGFAALAARRKARGVYDALEGLRRALPASPWSSHELADFAEHCRREWADDEALGKRLAKWGSGEFVQAEERAVGDASAVAAASRELAPLLQHLCRIDPELLELALRLLRGLVAELESRLRVRGIATFAELLRRARDLLIRHPAVAARERARIDQLLVDEFQDTDRTQCEMLRALALAGGPGERPGLFLVGDPKQSIYGWRSADLAAYEAFREEVLRADGRVETLCVNYRSVPEVLAEVERVVAPVMLREPAVQPGFEPLLPDPARATQPLAEGLAPIEYWVSSAWDAEAAAPLAHTLARDAAEREAGALARELRALHDAGGFAWKDAGVLFRGRGDLETYLRAFRASGIPFAVEKDRSYFQRREIIDAAALVRAIADPNDHVALLAALRSPLAGVPDAALLPLWREGLPARVGRLVAPCEGELAELRELAGRVARELPEEVPGIARIEGWHEAFAALLESIARLRRSLEEDPCDLFVERLRTLCLFEVTEAARHLGPWRVANLDRFFRELAESLAAEGGVRALLRALRRAVAGEQQREESRPREATQDAVAVMTIHGAKGLDFRHVYLMQLHKEQGRGAVAPVQAGRERADGALELEIFGAPSPGFDRVARARERVAEAERVRTLYVAMTRAEDRLVLAGLWPRAGAADKGSLAGLVARGLSLATHPDERMADLAAGASGERIDADGARWVFPALAPTPEEPGAAAPRAGMPAPGPEQVARESLALSERRTAALARQGRPFLTTASGSVGEEDLDALSERRFGEPLRARAASDADAALEAAVARAVGVAIHALLEEFDFAAEPESALARARERLGELVRGAAEPGAQDDAIERAEALLERIARGELLARLRALGADLLYRELPVLIPAEQGDLAVACITGVVDLVYRDPASGELVIADYKTDRVEDAAALRARAGVYLRQGAVYQRALRDGLGLDTLPRFELWFLHADRIEALPAVAV